MYDFSTASFEGLYNKAVAEGTHYKKEAKWRQIIAYILKGIAIAGGLALAAGLPKEAAQVTGIVIAAVVAADELFANYKRLIVAKEASYAYFNLFDKVAFKYNQDLDAKVIAVRDRGPGTKDENHKNAFEALTRINQEYSTLIYENTRDLKEKVQKADISFLASVAQDKNKDRVSTKDY